MLRYFGFSVFCDGGRARDRRVRSAGGGAPAGRAVLGVLEVCLSFDNAVVNAKVLRRMSPLWRKLFLYVGIFIAVFACGCCSRSCWCRSPPACRSPRSGTSR
jgi:hypothetical protein